MTRSLRVVTEGGSGDQTMAEAIEAAAKVANAAQPIAVLFMWETSDGKMTTLTIPASRALLLGMCDALYDEVHPPADVAE